MVVVGGPRAEQTQDVVIFKKNEGLRIFGEVFVDLRPEGCPNPPEGCPKPLGGPPYRALPIGALPIGPYKGPIRALYRALFWALFSLCGNLSIDHCCSLPL